MPGDVVSTWAWVAWLALILVFLIVEVLTLDFTFLMLAIGSFGGLIAGLVGARGREDEGDALAPGPADLDVETLHGRAALSRDLLPAPEQGGRLDTGRVREVSIDVLECREPIIPGGHEEEVRSGSGLHEVVHELLAADNENPRVTLVARPGRSTREELPGEPTAYSPYGVVLAGGDPRAVPAVAEGRAHAFPAGIWTFGGPRSAEQIVDAYVDLLTE